MELNEEPDEEAPGDEGTAEEATTEETEEEVVASDGAPVPELEEEPRETVAAAETAPYASEYDAEGIGDSSKQSLLRRLSPYLTVAGIFLILRIVIYSFRRRHR